jgi:uncharacterized membrane protein
VSLVLIIHVAAGTTGLILGPIAMIARKRRGRHTRVGEVYHWVMLAVCLSAAAMALADWSRIWWFLPIATFSYANALLGYLAAKIRWRGWLAAHIGGMCGSYIALVTALLIVNFRPVPLWLWFLPSIVGTPLIMRTIALRLGRSGPRPRPDRPAPGAVS